MGGFGDSPRPAPEVVPEEILKLYVDDSLDADVLAARCRKAGHSLISPRAVGLSGVNDAVHLRFAVEQKVPILTADRDDFRELHELVLAVNGHHTGILLVRRGRKRREQMSAARVVRALTRLEAAGINLHNRWIILNQWQ